MVENIKECEICGSETSIARSDKENHPPEGEVCRVCDRWICVDHVDWPETPPPICTECSEELL